MVTPDTRAQLQRVNDPAGILVLLRLAHASFGAVHLVNDNRNWTIAGQEWVGFPFRFKLPPAVAGQPARGMLEMDNVGRSITEVLEGLPPGAALQSTVRLVSRARPDVADYEFSAPLSQVRVTPALVTAQVGNDDALRAPGVKVRFDPRLAPGLFAG